MLKETLNKWLKVDPVSLVFQILSNRAILNQIENWNRQQLLEGKNSFDVKLSDIGGEYSEFTLSIHPEKVKDRVNLFDTGEFHESISVKVDNSLLFTADPFKTNERGETTNLYDRWGIDTIGLNEENFNQLIEQVQNLLILKILEEV